MDREETLRDATHRETEQVGLPRRAAEARLLHRAFSPRLKDKVNALGISLPERCVYVNVTSFASERRARALPFNFGGVFFSTHFST